MIRPSGRCRVMYWSCTDSTWEKSSSLSLSLCHHHCDYHHHLHHHHHHYQAELSDRSVPHRAHHPDKGKVAEEACNVVRLRDEIIWVEKWAKWGLEVQRGGENRVITDDQVIRCAMQVGKIGSQLVMMIEGDR